MFSSLKCIGERNDEKDHIGCNKSPIHVYSEVDQSLIAVFQLFSKFLAGNDHEFINDNIKSKDDEEGELIGNDIRPYAKK